MVNLFRKIYTTKIILLNFIGIVVTIKLIISKDPGRIFNILSGSCPPPSPSRCGCGFYPWQVFRQRNNVKEDFGVPVIYGLKSRPGAMERASKWFRQDKGLGEGDGVERRNPGLRILQGEPTTPGTMV